jgi:exopolysaccharide biosynthesis WecB/TagA/CpsF family protein
LAALAAKLNAAFPKLVVGGFESPLFRPLTRQEDAESVERINTSGGGLVFVGLGCPKQEFWMQAHRGQVNAVMLGVGAAFDLSTFTVSRAPRVDARARPGMAAPPGIRAASAVAAVFGDEYLVVWGAVRQLVGRRF